MKIDNEDFSYSDDDKEGWEKRIISPIHLMNGLSNVGMLKGWNGSFPYYIKYEPDVKQQYFRREQTSHDGTHLFSYELDAKLMMPIIKCESFFKTIPQPSEDHIPIYTIGDILRLVHYQNINVPAGKIFGMVERLVMPVKVDWLPLEEIK